MNVLSLVVALFALATAKCLDGLGYTVK